MKNIQIILSELTKNAGATQDIQHLATLKKLLRAREYDALHQHIIKKTQEGFLKSAYQKKLSELLPHVVVSSKDERHLRLKTLLKIINLSNNLEEVEEALDTGMAIVLNDTYKDTPTSMISRGESALLAAIKKRDKTLIEYLLSKGASLKSIQNINLPVNDQGETILHIACDLKLYDLIPLLIQNSANLNAKRHDGMTPLHIAAKNNDNDIALLLLNKGADPNESLDRENKLTPFLMAVFNKNFKLASAMLEFNYKVNEIDLLIAKKHNDALYTRMRQPIKSRKKNIISKARLRFLGNSLTRLDSQILHPIFQQLFVDNENQQKEIMTEITNIYHGNNSILRPLLELASISAMGQHIANNKKNKKLKIMMSDSKNVDELTKAGSACSGLYKAKNTIYVAGFHGDTRMALAALLHELKHFADQQIYGHTTMPYKASQKDHFDEVKKILQQNAKTFIANKWKHGSEADKFIYSSIHSVFENYDTDKQNAEILVKVPEILGYLGMTEGYKWLEKNEPALLAFYEHRFNPACHAYLIELRNRKPANDSVFGETSYKQHK